MTHACHHCGEDVGELVENADGLAGHLAVRALEVRDGAIHVKCRRCSKWSGLPLRVSHAPPTRPLRIRVTRRVVIPTATPA